MSEQAYTFSVASDFSGSVYLAGIHQEVRNSSIASATFRRIEQDGDVLRVIFDGALSAGDETTLNTVLVPAHSGTPPATSYELKSQETFATNAREYVDITGMSYTPPAGEWFVNLSLSMENSKKQTSKTSTFAIAVDGVVQSETMRKRSNTATIHIPAILTANGTQSISVQCKTSSGNTLTVLARSMTFVKI